MHWRKTLISLIVFSAIVFFLYFPALRAPFFHDDIPEVLRNPAVVEPSRLPSFFSPRGLWQRPLTLMTYQFSAWIGEGDPLGFHLVNIALHAIAAFVLFLWVRGRFPRVAPWCALLFLVHPLATSSVSYTSGRGYVLGTLLLLLALLAASGGTRRRALVGFSLALLACLAKPFFLVFLVLVPIAAMEDAVELRAVRRRWYLFAAPFLLLLLYLIVQLPAQLGNAVIPADLLFRAQPMIWGKILELFLAPLRLGFFYGAELVGGVSPVRFLLAHLLAAAALFAVAFKLVTEYQRWGRRWLVPVLWLVLGMFGLTLLPKNELLAEWRLSPLLPPLALISCGALLAALDRVRCPRRAAAVILALIVVAAGALTWRHNHIWRSEAMAWRSFFEANPRSLSHRFNYASALAEAGRFDEAKALYRDVLAAWQEPRSGANVALDAALIGRTWCSLGWIALKQDRPELAVSSFRKAIVWDPAWIRSWRGLGKALAATGERAHGMQAETMDSFIRMERGR